MKFTVKEKHQGTLRVLPGGTFPINLNHRNAKEVQDYVACFLWGEGHSKKKGGTYSVEMLDGSEVTL